MLHVDPIHFVLTLEMNMLPWATCLNAELSSEYASFDILVVIDVLKWWDIAFTLNSEQLRLRKHLDGVRIIHDSSSTPTLHVVPSGILEYHWVPSGIIGNHSVTLGTFGFHWVRFEICQEANHD